MGARRRFGTLRKVKVLVVDDSVEVRTRFVAMIVEAGVPDVYEASDADLALERAAALLPRVVLLDLNLTGKSGFFVLVSVKKIAPPPAVVVATNHFTPAYRRRCMSLGADAFFDKSGDVGRIVACVVELARGSA